MNTTPENVLDESLIQEKVVCAQLLIKTNTQDIVHKILNIYMVGLEIRTMQVGEFKLLVQLDMKELFSGRTLTTFGYLKLMGDILMKLKQQIDTDIETLYQVIAEQPGRGHTVCMTMSQL